VLELCGAREVTHVIGTFPDVRQAICIFETVCCLMRDGGASFRPQDLAFALEMNDKRMPHMPPSLIRGHLGIAFLPQKLEWVRRNGRKETALRARLSNFNARLLHTALILLLWWIQDTCCYREVPHLCRCNFRLQDYVEASARYVLLLQHRYAEAQSSNGLSGSSCEDEP
jgi:hypothetical protein